MIINVRQMGKCCAKGLLMLLNFLCILTAMSTFAFAVVDTRVLKQYGDEEATGTLISDIIIIITCFLVMGVAVFGLFGAAKENVKILYLYVGLLMILVLIELLIGIFVAVQRYGLEFRVTNWMREEFYTNSTGDGLEVHNKLWDKLQMNYECCGLNGPDDYKALQRPLSMSCCPRAYRAKTMLAQQQMYKACVESSDYFHEGCEEEVLYVLRSDADWLLGVAFLSFCFEATGMLLAMSIANNLKLSATAYKASVKY